jgi:hypothetical protein
MMSNHCAREDFLYELKAGPAGGRLRRPSSRRQRHDGHRGTGLTLSTRASQSSDEDAVWTTLGLALPPASRRSSRCEVGWPHDVVVVLIAGWALRPISMARTRGRTKSSRAKVIAGPR